MGALRDISDSEFDAEVLGSDGPVLVDFWAPWCGPCRALTPILEDISAEHGDKLKVVKVNIDDNPQITAKYGITSVPTCNVFKDGELVKQIMGAHPKPKMIAELQEFIG